ncbi:MAG TPA: hypothetical protein IAC70_05610 [Candidatus Faecicola pullistercoris]|nr:hypothetical protein [Candidatus Faecicola pullistercoris]
MIHFYLNSEKLKAMSANAGKKKIKVTKIYDLDFPNEFLNDPDQDKLDVKLTEAMLNIIRAGDIKSKTASFVVDHSKIPFREMLLPAGTPAKLSPIIKGELFTDKKMAEANTVDYIEVERNVNQDKQSRVLVTYMDNTIIDNLKKCCKDVGMGLKSINIQQNCLTKLVNFMKEELPENFMLVDYRVTYTTTYLFSKGEHIFSMTKSIFSVPSESFANETAFFINDISLQLSDAMSFFLSKYDNARFDTIFVTGSTFLFEPCLPQISSMLNRTVKLLPKPEKIEGVGIHEFNDYSSLIGSLVKK